MKTRGASLVKKKIRLETSEGFDSQSNLIVFSLYFR